MKSIKKLVAILLVLSVFIIPTFAAGRDTTYYISNITIPAFRGWGEASVYDNSYGPFLFVRLNQTGDKVDTVDFVGSCEGTHITDIGQATEGVTENSRVNYNDGRNDVGRWLTGIKFRSSNSNYGSYSINGIAIY